MEWTHSDDEAYAEMMLEYPQAEPYIARSFDIDRQLEELRARVDVLEGKPELPRLPRVNVLLLSVKEQKGVNDVGHTNRRSEL